MRRSPLCCIALTALLAGLTACSGGGGGDGGGTTPPPPTGDATLSFGYKAVGTDGAYYVFHNADTKVVSFTADTDLSTAAVLADGAVAGTSAITSPTGVKVTGTTVTLDPLTSAILRKR